MKGTGTPLLAYGPVIIYEFRQRIFMSVFFKPRYAWKYYDKDVFYGPFKTFAECQQHFTACLIASGRVNGYVPNNVIPVNFKTKKRIQ